MDYQRTRSLPAVRPQSSESSQDIVQPNPDWQDKNTVLQSLSTICCTDIFSDVNFTFPNHHNAIPLPAHKNILAMRSSVFQAMFYGSLCETKKDVEITEVTPDVFKTFLRFLYTDNVSIDHQSAIPLLYTADKYQVFNLKEQCQDYLENSIDANNVCEIMNAAEMFNMTHLVNKSSEYIAEKARCIFQSDGFKSLTKSNLSIILSLEKLNIFEVDLFLACLKWSEQQCISRNMDPNPSNKKNVLETLFYKIRIPTMTLEDFSKHVATSGVLSESEQLQFFKYFTIQEKGAFITKFALSARMGYESEVIVSLNKNIRTMKSNFRALEETIYVAIISQSSSDGTRSQTVSNNDNIVLHLSEIKVGQSIMNQMLCDRCKNTGKPKFNICTSNDGMKSFPFVIESVDIEDIELGSDSDDDGYFVSEVSQMRRRGNQQTVSRNITKTKKYPVSTEQQDHLMNSFIPVHCRISSRTKISIRSKPCCSHQRRIYEAYANANRFQNVNVDSVQLVIKCEGVSVVERLVFQISA